MSELKYNRVRLSPEVLLQTVDNEGFMLDLRSEKYFGLNPVALRIWHLIRDEADVAKVRQQLLDEFDVSVDDLTRDMNALFDELIAVGLMQADAA
jgi:hypothetical protein